MKYKFIETEESYDGAQLASLRGYLKHGLLGDSIIAWVGPCNVLVEHMVDGEDLLAGAEIRGDKMLHFVVEKFESTLLAGVSLQRLLAAMVKDELQKVAGERALAASLFRDGDDIFVGDRKLSISIATQSPVSTLIHFAVNVTNEGTPVKTLSLGDLQIDAKSFALNLMQKFSAEVLSIRDATMKVRWVK